jgi:hypothetical protein
MDLISLVSEERAVGFMRLAAAMNVKVEDTVEWGKFHAKHSALMF